MYVPLAAITHGSPLLSQTTPKMLAQFAAENNYASIGLADYDQLYMSIQYYLAMKEKGLTPIMGMRLRVYGEDESAHVIILCKNLAGWKQLLKLVYLANQDYKNGPRLEVFKFIQNVTPDLIIIVDNFIDIFERFLPTAYFGLNLIDKNGRTTKLKTVPITPNHYLNEKDWGINRILAANYLKMPVSSDHTLLTDNTRFIYNERQLLELGYTQEQIDETGKIFEQIENYEILKGQQLPHFDCPRGYSEDEYLRQLCRDGYKRRNLNDPAYVERIKYELEVISQAGMSGYFLIMQDIMSWARSQNILLGTGRGSAAGCLISYLVGITNVDPLKYDLLFERFYTPQRKGDMVDIDVDLPPSRREEIINYTGQKYGLTRFAQLSTFTTLKGPAALKAALRARGVDSGEQNYITKLMPPEGKIAPYLQKQFEEVGSKSMVLWCINHIDELHQWCSPKMEGLYAEEFKLAIELDQTITGRGRHASAYALSNEPIYENAPLIWDESAERFVVGLNMDDAEKVSLVKLDLLGLDLLDKADLIRRVVKNGAF